MPPVELDKDLADTLTPEELEAINESEHSPDEIAAIKNIAGNDDPDDDEDDDDDEEESGSAAPVEGKKNPDDNEAEAGSQAADPVDEQVEQPGEFKTRYKAEVPADLEEQITAVAADKKALAQQFRDGDIDLDEFNTKSEELDSRRDELNRIKFKAEVFEDMNAQSGQQAWENTVNSFVSNVAKAEGIDYRKDADKAGDLDIFVKRLAENKANEGKPMNWFLQEAHRRVKALHGIQDKPAAQETPEDKLKAARESRKPPIEAAPKTLAQVPGGDGPGDVTGEFSDVEGLEGLELEDAIARMTPAQRERFLKA